MWCIIIELFKSWFLTKVQCDGSNMDDTQSDNIILFSRYMMDSHVVVYRSPVLLTRLWENARSLYSNDIVLYVFYTGLRLFINLTQHKCML